MRKLSVLLISMLLLANFAFADENTVTLSFAGDTTLGKDAITKASNTLPNMVKTVKNDYSYFLKNVKYLFENDDLTFVNLETTLTTATTIAVKEFRFKGLPEYAKILTEGSVEVVSMANNHTMDYGKAGYDETIKSLTEAGVNYVSPAVSYVKEVKGVKIGVLGFKGWDNSSTAKKVIKTAIDKLKESGCTIVVVMFHWGSEAVNVPNKVQEGLARYTIDSGATTVLGSHAHVIQSVEVYKGKTIIYGLGNFCYGGHSNPKDKDALIVQQTFNLNSEQLSTTLVPCSISSSTKTNNFQPTPLTGDNMKRVLDRLRKYSEGRLTEITAEGLLK